jgi:phage-related tail fiber protein
VGDFIRLKFNDTPSLVNSSGLALLPEANISVQAGDIHEFEAVSTGWRHIQETTNQAGEVAYFALTTAPAGWLKANGALISRTTFARLFARIGTTYGAGDGSTTFALPELRGEFIRGLDDGRGSDPSRTLGTYQNGSLVVADITNSSINLPVPYGLGVGNTALANLGYDLINPLTYPNAYIMLGTAIDTQALTFADTVAGQARPRNQALLACIRY